MKFKFWFLFVFLFNAHTFFSKNKIVCDSANAGNNQQACSDSILLNGNIPINGIGTWSCLTSSVIIFNPGSDSTVATGLAVGQNYFVWTITGAGGCPTVSDTVIYTVDSIPTRPSAGMDQSICGNTGSLSGNQISVGTGMWVVVGGTGTLSNPYSLTPSFSNLSLGQNTFRWTSSAGSCVRYDEVVISSFDLPSPSSAGPDKMYCDTVFFLSANNPSSGIGLWSLIDGVGKIFKPNFANTSVDSTFYGDTLTFVWTITSGPCPSSTDTVSVIINIPPSQAFAGNDQIVCSGSAILSSLNVSVGTGVWSQLSSGSIITDTLSPSTIVSALSPGNNYFVWSVSNGVCPLSRDTVNISNLENITPNAGQDQNLCALNSNLAATAVSSGSGVWSLISGGGSILQPNSNTSLVSNLGIGQNIFVWTVSNGVCPLKTDTVILTVYAPSTTAFAGQDMVVCGSVASLNGSGAVNGIGTWTVVSGTGNFSSVNSGSTIISGLSAGQNVLAWTIVNGACPPSSDTIIVTSVPPTGFAFAGNDTTVCSDSIQLNASAPLAGNGTWGIVTNGPQISNINISNPSASGLLIGQNVFVWTVSAAGNCPSTTDTVVVTREQYPTVASAGQDVFTDQVEISLNANIPTVGSGIWSVVGQAGNIISPTTPNSIFNVSETGEYALVWTISNGICPSSSDTVRINVLFEQLPQVITPNGDGKNDVFKINPLLFNENIELFIYNRWGNLVYENKDYRHDFSGKNSSGVELPDDTYLYEVYVNGIVYYKNYLLIKRK
jgi:gliding motility-associated-like protein